MQGQAVVDYPLIGILARWGNSRAYTPFGVSTQEWVYSRWLAGKPRLRSGLSVFLTPKLFVVFDFIKDIEKANSLFFVAIEVWPMTNIGAFNIQFKVLPFTGLA